jgi:hypothetical protein
MNSKEVVSEGTEEEGAISPKPEVAKGCPKDRAHGHRDEGV